MNTAKNLQLLDAQSNNISPATNIESLYYEINQGGAVFRNAIYKHFPVYVKYNNNVDQPYVVSNGVVGVPSGAATESQVLNFQGSTENTDGATLVQGSGDTHILASSIKQTRLGGTRYYKLDVQTYDLTHILQQFPSKKWVKNTFDRHDTSIHNIIYESPLYRENMYVKMPNAVGGYPAGTRLGKLSETKINQILDDLLFPDAQPKLGPVTAGWGPSYTGDIPTFFHVYDHDATLLHTNDTSTDVFFGCDYDASSMAKIDSSGGLITPVYVSADGTTDEADKYSGNKAKHAEIIIREYPGNGNTNTVILMNDPQTDGFFTCGEYGSYYDATVTVKVNDADAGALHTLRGKKAAADGIMKTAEYLCVGGQLFHGNIATQQVDAGNLHYRIRNIIPVLGYIAKSSDFTDTDTIEKIFQCVNYLKQPSTPSDVTCDYIRDYGENTLEFWYTPTRDTYFMIPNLTKYVDFSEKQLMLHVSQVCSGMGWSPCNIPVVYCSIVDITVRHNCADAQRIDTGEANSHKWLLYKLPSTRTEHSSGGRTTRDYDGFSYSYVGKPYSKLRLSIRVAPKAES